MHVGRQHGETPPSRQPLLLEVAPAAGLTEEIIDLLVDAARIIRSPFSQIGGWLIGGAASRVDAPETAVGDREEGLELNVTAAWLPSMGQPDPHVDWARRCCDMLSPFGRGVYANFVSDEEDDVESAYGDRLVRLTALKDRIDPTNVVRCKRQHRAEPMTGPRRAAVTRRRRDGLAGHHRGRPHGPSSAACDVTRVLVRACRASAS